MSVSSTPMGSVATSPLPIRLQTYWISSGKAASNAFSMRVLYRIDSLRSVPAKRTTLTAIAPSESLGTNSKPRFGKIMPNATASVPKAKPITAHLCCMVNLSSGA